MHCIQYALVGPNSYTVYCTENLTDAQVRDRAFSSNARIERFNRCPVCEQWTMYKGKLRDINCPAVIAFIKSGSPI